MKLNEKQRLFVHEYLIDLSATAAAKRAGYSEKTAHSQGPRLLAHVGVKAEIDRLMAKRVEKVEIDAEWVLKRASLLADFNIKNFMRVNDEGEPVYDFTDATDEDWYCITEMTIDTIGRGQDEIPVERVRLKTVDRLRALEIVGKHIKVQAFKDVVEHTVDDNVATILSGGRRRASSSED